MKYMGSKSRIKKYILPIIQERIDYGSYYVYMEPFVGGANVIDGVRNIKRIGADKNKYLIALFQNLDKVKTMPDIITKEEYVDVRDSYKNNTAKYEDWYKGAVGFLSSYNGKFFDGGYSGVRTISNGTVRNYYLEAKNNLLKQSLYLKDIEWICGDYRETTKDLQNAIIYCDIPYKGTANYDVSKNFDYNAFYEWCRQMSKSNIVLVSEEWAPSDFKCLWSMEQSRTLDCHSTKNTVEKLFSL